MPLSYIKRILDARVYDVARETPVDEAPQLPDGYWEKVPPTTARRITLAGYRIADLILSAADQIEAERKFLGRP